MSDPPVHLEVLACTSSEDDDDAPTGAPGSGLSSVLGAMRLRQVLGGDNAGAAAVMRGAGWRSARFCEFPQEIVLCICRGAPTVLGKVLIMADEYKIPSRIELFVASSNGGRQSALRFRRLGYVTFQNCTEHRAETRELKSIPMPHEPLTHLKLLLHRSHANPSNRFNQVGLDFVVAMPPGHRQLGNDEASLEATLASFSVPHESATRSPNALSDALLGPLRAKYADPTFALTSSKTTTTSLTRPYPSAPQLTVVARSRDIWLPHRSEYASPEQILTRIHLGRQRAESIDGYLQDPDSPLRAWQIDEYECREHCERLTTLELMEGGGATPLPQTSDDRIQTRLEIDRLHKALVLLDERNSRREDAVQRDASAALALRLATSPVRKIKSMPPTVGSSGVECFFPEKRRCLASDNWRTREEFLWRVVEVLKDAADDSTTAEPELVRTAALPEALQMTHATVQDQHPQVFIAACSLLQVVLRRHPVFQEASAWKQDAAVLLRALAGRLDDIQPAIRNNAAFAIIQVAESTRGKGTFVMHLLLTAIEKHELRVTDQVIFGLLKIFSALLLAFHCCATIDIAPKRVLRFVLATECLTHENALVREAARQMLVILHGEVGGELIITFLRKKHLPPDVVVTLETLFASLGDRQAASAPETRNAPEPPTSAKEKEITE